MNNKSISAALALLASTAAAELRIVNYNICNGNIRSPYLNTVLEAICQENYNGITRDIDILFLQEQTSTSTTSVKNILNSIVDGSPYSSVYYASSNNAGGLPAVVYNTNTVQLLGTTAINNTPRAAIRYKFQPIGYSSDAAFYAYNCHLKASQDYNYERGIEAANIRTNSDSLGRVPIIYTGDMNFYSGYTENGYRNFLAAGEGQAFDPLTHFCYGVPLLWHDNSAAKQFHTQCPITDNRNGFSGGGVDDRFDFQLLTEEMVNSEGVAMIRNSYHTFGNNGTHNTNSNISSGYWPGTTTSQKNTTVLNALENSSDHLPVIVDYQLPAVMEVAATELPSDNLYVPIGKDLNVSINIRNTATCQVSNGADELDYAISSKIATSSIYDELPAPWQMTQIGNSPITPASSGYCQEPESFRLAGSGSISSTSDSFAFINKITDSNSAIESTISSIEGNGNASGGIMIRNSLSSDSAFVCLEVAMDNTLNWKYRRVDSAALYTNNCPDISLPCHLRITQANNYYSCASSPEGNNWTIHYTTYMPPFDETHYHGYFATNGNSTSSPSTVFIGEYIQEQQTVNILDTGTIEAGDTDTHNISLNTSSIGTQKIKLIIKSNSEAALNSYFSKEYNYTVVPYGDLNMSQTVDTNDLRIMLESWTADNTTYEDGDLNEDNTINLIDFSILAHNWLE